MTLPRGIVAIWAMARPSRPLAEAEAVRAAALLVKSKSVEATAAAIARRVVADALAYLDMDVSDPLIAALAELERAAARTPFITLARCPEIDTTSEVIDRRCQAFRARGGRQISEAAWRRETDRIAADLTAKLAHRYARHLRGK